MRAKGNYGFVLQIYQILAVINVFLGHLRLQGQRVAGTTELMRELGGTHGTGFGLTTNLDEVRAGTILALQSAVGILSAKAPDELEPYRQMVLGVATAVAEAKKGVSPSEDAVIGVVKETLGAS